MTLVAMALSTTALRAHACSSHFSGFYAGLQAGGNASHTKYDKSAAPYVANGKLTKEKTAFFGGLFAGYGAGMGKCSYLGAELYANLAEIRTKLEGQYRGKSFEVKHHSPYNLGGKLRLGYTINTQAMVFVGLGGEYAKTTLKGSSQSYNRPLFSFTPAIGVDMFLNKNVFARGEYTYLIGGRQNFRSDHDTGSSPGFKVKTNQHRFVVGLGYKF